MMRIVAIMPCFGRVEQTESNIRRLHQTAGFSYELICTAFEPEVWKSLKTMGDVSPTKVACFDRPITYWQGMQYGMKYLPSGTTHIVNLANDLLPGYRWLKRGIEAYIRRFDRSSGLMGFNDGIHGPEHSSHFIIDIRLLETFGGWPTWYQHNYGDTEICSRAQEQNVYGKAAWAVLYHNHRVTGALGDEVYDTGDKSARADQALFMNRKSHQWPLISSSIG